MAGKMNGTAPEQTKQETLEALQRFIEQNGYAPTYPELGDMFGISYVAAYYRVVRLARDKKVKFRHGKQRNIILV